MVYQGKSTRVLMTNIIEMLVHFGKYHL